MRVLVATWSGLPGGSGRNLLDLVDALDTPPVVYVPEGPVAVGARERGVPVITHPERSLLFRGRPLAAATAIAAHAAELRQLSAALDPDLVVAWGMRTLLASWLSVRGKHAPPVLFSHPDLLPEGAPGRAVRIAARWAGQAVCASQAIAEDLDPDGRMGSLSVVHHGVDLARFRPGRDERGRTALTLGAIVGWKRLDLALDAVARVQEAMPGTNLRVVGSPLGVEDEALADRLRARSRDADLLGRVDLLEATENPVTELQNAGCLLHCADREPYGRVIAEALACGTPVVAAAGGGPAELVDAQSGRLYPAGDVDGAAQALVEVLGDEARWLALRRGARARAEALLGVERTYTGLRRAVEAAARPRRLRAARAASVCFVVVTHESENELAALLRSLSQHLPEAQVVVVDSGSTDGSADVARRWPGQATVIELGENVGFGRAVNIGLEQVDRAVTIVANPDVELVDDSLGELAERVQGSDRLLAPLLLGPDGSRQPSVHPAPTSAPDLIRALCPPAILPRPLAARLAPQLSRRPRPVGWAVGACLVARTDTLRRLGGFDESIFLYGEDLDLGLRAHAAGVDTWFCPGSRVLHRESHSTARAFDGEPFGLLADQRQRVVGERLGPWRARVDAGAQLVTFLSRIVLKGLAGREVGRERRQFGAAVSAARRRLSA